MITLQSFSKKALLYYQDMIESTIVEERLLDQYKTEGESSVLCQLRSGGMINKRFNAMIDTIDEANVHVCPDCQSQDWSIDCPMAICRQCKHEIFVSTPQTHSYCQSCDGYTVGTCHSKQYIDPI